MPRRPRSGLPKFCCWNQDRPNGLRRVRFRRNGRSIYLSGAPWSESFMRQYFEALEGAEESPAADRGAVSGSAEALVTAYLAAPTFQALATETKRSRGGILNHFRTEHGDKPVFRTEANGRRTMLLTREHIQVMVNARAATPFAQRNFLNSLRGLARSVCLGP